jgi:hypothetical protein
MVSKNDMHHDCSPLSWAYVSMGLDGTGAMFLEVEVSI